MHRPALLASILLLLSACGKPADEAPIAPPDYTELTDSTTVLFQVFGDGDDLRAAPIAAVAKGHLGPLVLDDAGWRMLDSIFFATGRSLSIYRDGAGVGTVEVLRGMWPADSAPLYDLPGCRALVPQALLRLRLAGSSKASAEYLASTTPLKQGREIRALVGEPAAIARPLADSAAATEGLGAEELARLEFVARSLRTGAGSSGHTTLGSYVDPEAGDAGPGAGHSSAVLVLAEDSAKKWIPSYRHVASGEARTVEFQRLVNHADLDGDGVDEIILEAWRYAQVPEFRVLRRAGGRWAEAFAVRQNWCLDLPAGAAR